VNLIISLFWFAQSGITFIPAAPARVVATVGAIVCTAKGNAVPATAVTVTCLLGTLSNGPHTFPIPPGSALTFTQTFNGDTAGFIFTLSTAGQITWQAGITPATGAAAQQSGVFP
jgi:hypothetical protein